MKKRSRRQLNSHVRFLLAERPYLLKMGMRQRELVIDLKG
jgi:hypothetical protein